MADHYSPKNVSRDAIANGDQCPNCFGSFEDNSVKKMTQDQVDLLEAGVCPWCGFKL